MADGRKRPGPLEDSFSSRTKQRFSLPNISRHEAQKHEEGYRWCPRRARHVPDTRGLLSPDCTNLLGLGAFLRGLPGCSLMLAV